MKQTVVLGITSGIAAYKSLELVKHLREAGVTVQVIMTHHATKMVSPTEFERVSGQKVSIELFEKGFDYKHVLTSRKVDHIELADKADVMVIAPATANIIAKLAYGMADDFLTTTALAVTAPIILCPSMNVNMWHNPLVQNNIAILKKAGYHIIDPTSGMLACGYEGEGRLADIPKISEEILQYVTRTSLFKGQKILVTAGGTAEPIDEIRSITNRSSGRMGVAIAEACYLQGADILLLRAKNAIAPRYQIREEIFTTTDELRALMQKYVPDYDYCFHAAAVSDFTVKNPRKGKLSSQHPLSLTLEPQVKILDQIKTINPAITVIAFKAEYGLSETKLMHAAQKRLRESDADAIIANDVSKKFQGFDAENNEVTVVLSDGTSKHFPLASKNELAKLLVNYLAEQLRRRKQ